MLLRASIVCCLIVSMLKVASPKSRKGPDYSGRSKEISCDCSSERTAIKYLEHPVNHPWVTALFYDDMFLCGGVIVDTQYILTAAHCFSAKMNEMQIKLVDKGKLRRFKVVFNTNITNTLIIELSITNLIVPDGYKYNGGYPLDDVALVKLSRPLLFTNGIQSICLAHDKTYYQDKVIAGATGWGSKIQGGPPSSSLKKKVQLPIVSNKDCKKFLGIHIPDSNLCAGGQKGNDLCHV